MQSFVLAKLKIATKYDFMFKILGRQLQWELTNDKIIEKLDTLIEEWLNKVNSISLSGCIKSWIVDINL